MVTGMKFANLGPFQVARELITFQCLWAFPAGVVRGKQRRLRHVRSVGNVGGGEGGGWRREERLRLRLVDGKGRLEVGRTLEVRRAEVGC
jgi:hypothetical protein